MIAFPRTTAGLWAGLLLSGGFFLLSATGVRAEEDSADDGLFETVQNPITDATLTHLKNRIDRAINQKGRRIKKIVFDFNPGETEAASPNYGSCRDFAEYIKRLKDTGVNPIAFVHAKTYRHTVLPVLACNDLVMSTTAKIGEAGLNEVPSADIVEKYAQVAGLEKEAVVLKMLDRDITVVTGRLKGNTIFVDLDKFRKQDPRLAGVFVDDNPTTVLAAGTLGLYDLKDAMRFKLCTQEPAETRAQVAERYHLAASSVNGERAVGQKIKAVKIDIAGPIDETMLGKLKSQFREVRSRRENMIFFVLQYATECGGSAKCARDIADEIQNLTNDDKDPVWTVAFIPDRAPDLATFIAFACSEIVMFKGSDPKREAVLGDFGPFFNTAGKGGDPSNTLDGIQRNLREIVQRQYPAQIVEGLVDRDSEILQVRDKTKPGGGLELLNRAELKAAQQKNAQLVVVRTIKQPGSYLEMNTTLARELRVAAQSTVDNKDPRELYALYGVPENEVRDSKPGWLDDFAAFLRRIEIVFLLLAVAFASLILEFKMPGATIPGLISLTCFVLFFWSQAYAHGATIYLAVALFVLGLLMLGVEIFILPGFGVMGIGGAILILASLGLATMEKAPSSPDEWVEFGKTSARYGAAFFVSCAMAFALARFLPKIPYANRLMLVPPTDKPDMEGELTALPGAEQAAALLGQVGTATSMLRPAGMARIGDRYVDVVTEGDFIEPGTSIQVVEVEGTRIVVKKA
jgi:membrane-bound serine protease (ClpP class)